MCAVSNITFLVPGQGSVVNEIVSIDIIDISVAVIIDSALAVEFLLIHPHVCPEVGMVIFDTFVNYSHDD